MAWTTPRTWATSEIVTSSHMNTHVRDNTQFLYDNGWQMISNQVVAGSAAANVTFSSIPSTFRSLKVVWKTRASSGGTESEKIRMTANSFSAGTDYLVSGNPSGAGYAAYVEVGYVAGSVSTGNFGSGTVEILEYANAERHYGVGRWVSQVNRGGIGTDLSQGSLGFSFPHSGAVAAVTSLVFVLSTGSHDIGARFTLYGQM